MQITYTPAGADPRVWEFKPGKLLNAEAEAIERHTGWTYTEFGQKFLSGSIVAYHAMLYVFLKRTIPTLKYDEVVFSSDEIDVDYDAEEYAALIDALEEKSRGEGLTSDELDALEMFKAKAEVPVVPLEPATPSLTAEPVTASS